MTGAHPVFGFMGVSLPPLSLSLLATRHLLLGYSTVPGCGVQGPYAAHTAHWRKPEKQDERLTRQTHCAEAKWLVKMTMLMKEREISSSRVTREGYLKESSFSWTSEGRQDPGKRGRALGGGGGEEEKTEFGMELLARGESVAVCKVWGYCMEKGSHGPDDLGRKHEDHVPTRGAAFTAKECIKMPPAPPC